MKCRLTRALALTVLLLPTSLIGMGTREATASQPTPDFNSTEFIRGVQQKCREAKMRKVGESQTAAIARLEKVVADFQGTPGAGIADVELGMLLLELDRSTEAAVVFRRVLDSSPPDAKNHAFSKATRGFIFSLLAQEQFDEALKFVEKSSASGDLPPAVGRSYVEEQKRIIQKWREWAPEKKRIRRLFENYLAAVTNGDIEAVRGLLTPEIAPEYITRLERAKSKGELGNQYKIDWVRVDFFGSDDRAKLEAGIILVGPQQDPKSRNRDFFMQFRKYDGAWKIERL